MPKTDEKLIDIAAEMRAYANRLNDAGGAPSPTDLRKFAERIERAANNLESSFGMALAIEDGLRKRDKHSAPCNAAAMREALGEIVLLTLKAGMSIRSDVACGIIKSKAKHALAAPARNCDKYGIDDIKEMDADFGAFCQQYGAKDGENCVGCPIKPMDNLCCHSAWMLLTAEGGAE